MGTKGHSDGGISLALLLVLLAVGITAAAVMPRCSSWYHQMQVAYETDCLVSDLRYLQQMARTATLPSADTRDELSHYPINQPMIFFDELHHQYHIKKRNQASDLRRHTYPENIHIIVQGNRSFLYFGLNNGTVTPNTIHVYYDGEFSRGRKIIVDSAGRIRVEKVQL